MYELISLRNDPPEVCVEDECYNSGKWLLSTFISYVLIRHPSVREIQESFASLKHIVSLELGCLQSTELAHCRKRNTVVTKEVVHRV